MPRPPGDAAPAMHVEGCTFRSRVCERHAAALKVQMTRSKQMLEARHCACTGRSRSRRAPAGRAPSRAARQGPRRVLSAAIRRAVCTRTQRYGPLVARERRGQQQHDQHDQRERRQRAAPSHSAQ